MKHLFVVLLLLLSTPVMARDVMRADAAYGVKYAAEQVELPKDQSRLYLTVVGNQSDPRYRTICEWFDRNPTLREMRDQTHFSAIPKSSPHWFERLAPNYRETPCVRLQAASGDIVAEFAGSDLPMTADALAHGLNGRAKNCFRRTPDDVDPTPQPLPAPVPRQQHFPWIALGLLTAAGSGLGFGKQWYDTYYKN
jgi:hypothetical protein